LFSLGWVQENMGKILGGDLRATVEVGKQRIGLRRWGKKEPKS